MSLKRKLYIYVAEYTHIIGVHMINQAEKSKNDIADSGIRFNPEFNCSG